MGHTRTRQRGSVGACGLVLVASGCGAGEPPDPTAKDTLRQHQITAPGDLLTTDGRLREPGWATTDLLRWDPERVADPSQLRQWDFFTIANGQVAVNLTLADVTFQLGSVGVVEMDTAATSSSVVLASTGGLRRRYPAVACR